MERILYIKANFKEENDSYSLKLGRKFIEDYKVKNPNVHVKEIDLYQEDLAHLDYERIGKVFSPESNELTKYVEEFMEYDKYVIVAPMWNLSIPSILKTYIDHIVVAGKTFKYTEEGPVGLLENKKALHITARGGLYSEGPGADFEMGDRYLRTILGFMGIQDFSTFSFEQTGIFSPEQLNEMLEEKYKEAKKLTEEF
ncbi:FMN-dependent NADH-azoreductase [uncultured Ilyobacter sp.]|uniref:FMN-dependent NADH-azoreductase n=1 Tax=uncultured Ilyobacter sp. TaxID=544433 RepID=UPI002AA848BA|nr:FMN-dependent NADH-azoreductase [uncultured Ilyobacter sp.]